MPLQPYQQAPEMPYTHGRLRIAVKIIGGPKEAARRLSEVSGQDVKERTIHSWLHEGRLPSLYWIRAIARLAKVPVDWICAENGDEAERVMVTHRLIVALREWEDLYR